MGALYQITISALRTSYPTLNGNPKRLTVALPGAISPKNITGEYIPPYYCHNEMESVTAIQFGSEELAQSAEYKILSMKIITEENGLSGTRSPYFKAQQRNDPNLLTPKQNLIIEKTSG
jgi:hypothetical protein